MWKPTPEEHYQLLKEWEQEFDKAKESIDELYLRAIDEHSNTKVSSLDEAYWQGCKDTIRRCIMIMDINRSLWGIINSSDRNMEHPENNIGKVILDRK